MTSFFVRNAKKNFVQIVIRFITEKTAQSKRLSSWNKILDTNNVITVKTWSRKVKDAVTLSVDVETSSAISVDVNGKVDIFAWVCKIVFCSLKMITIMGSGGMKGKEVFLLEYAVFFTAPKENNQFLSAYKQFEGNQLEVRSFLFLWKFLYFLFFGSWFPLSFLPLFY